MKNALIVAMVLLICVLSVGQTNVTFKNPDAQTAVKVADNAENAAQAEFDRAKAKYDAAMLAAKKKLVAELKADQPRVIKSGDAAEIAKLADLIAKTQADIDLMSVAAEEKAGRIDLLKLVKLPADVKSGTWRLANGALIVNDDGGGKLALNYKPTGEYNLRVSFITYDGGGRMGLQLAHAGKTFHWFMIGGTGKFSMVNDQQTSKMTTVDLPGGGLKLGVPHTCEVEVRDHALGVTLDGKQILSYRTDYSEISTQAVYEIVKDDLGVCSDWDKVTFTGIVVENIPAAK